MTQEGAKAHRRCRCSEKNPIMLIHEISRITHERVKKNCPEMQKSCRLIMMELARKDNVTQLDLVRATHLKAPTVSVSLQKMERDGLVLRRQDQDDLRAIRVFLTPKGRELDTQILKKIYEQDENAVSCLTAEELETLKQLLRKIKQHLIGGKDRLEKC